MAERPRILCVDDERHVLEGLQDTLRKSFDVTTASEPAVALELLDGQEPFDVILSDMRMPVMNGAVFLASARIKSPDSVRVLLTGYSDVSDAIDAVNKGEIFRFLTKPCPRETLLPALVAAVRQYRLATAERVLLEQTVRGCVKTLIEVMSLASPEACGRANRISAYAVRLAASGGAESTWEVETAGLLSQIAATAETAAILARVVEGAALGEREGDLVRAVPTVSGRYLRHIPRLEPVAEILFRQATPAPKLPSDDPAARHAKIFRLAHDLELLESCGSSNEDALKTLRGRAGLYDAELLDRLEMVCGTAVDGVIEELPLHDLTPGMRVLRDIHAASGVLLVTSRQILSDILLSRLRELPAGSVQEPITVALEPSP